MVVRELCRAATRSPRVLPSRHSTEHVSGNKVVSVGSDLCQLWTEFGHGPKTKFVVLVLLYIFRLRVMVIRVVD